MVIQLLTAPPHFRFVHTVNKTPTLRPENTRKKARKHAFVTYTIMYATEGRSFNAQLTSWLITWILCLFLLQNVLRTSACCPAKEPKNRLQASKVENTVATMDLANVIK